MALMHDTQPDSPAPSARRAGDAGGPVQPEGSAADSTAAADGSGATGGPSTRGPAADGVAGADAIDGSIVDGGAEADRAHAPEADGAHAPEAPIERPKSAYQLPTKQNTVLRNIIWAIVLTMVVVIVLAVGFFGVGSDLEREPLENAEVDVAASAQRAQEVADFPVAVPETGEGWQVRSARFTDGQPPAWTVQYTSPGGDLVTLAEDAEISAPVLSAAMPGASVTEETSLSGADCQVLGGGDGGAEQLGITCEGEGYGLLVHGTAEQAELEQLMTEALAAIG